jgi:hypothetical protein
MDSMAPWRRNILRLKFHSSLLLDDFVNLPKVMILFGLTFTGVMCARFVEGAVLVLAIRFIFPLSLPLI